MISDGLERVEYMSKSLLIGIVVIGLAALAACSSGDAMPNEPALPEDAAFIEQVEAAWTRAGAVLVIRGERSSVAISERGRRYNPRVGHDDRLVGRRGGHGAIRVGAGTGVAR